MLELTIKLLTLILDVLTAGNTYWYRKHENLKKDLGDRRK